LKAKFNALFNIIKETLSETGNVTTDNSILFVYPPDEEFKFRDYLVDTFIPLLRSHDLKYRVLNLSSFLFESFDEEMIEALSEDEFDDYRWMKQGLSKQVEAALRERLTELSRQVQGGTLLVYETAALYPLVRYSEVLRELRQLNCRVVLAFPGEERGGKLHFMDQPDGSNYLAVKLT
jgi:hypothetical protein